MASNARRPSCRPRNGGNPPLVPLLVMELPSAVTQALEDAGVAVAWLFGSRARGDDRPDSDADVALLLCPDADPPDLYTQAGLAEAFREPLGAGAVDIVLLDRAPLDLRARVVQEGRVLWSRDEPLRVAFTVQTQSYWEDVRPALEEMNRAYFRRLAASGFGGSGSKGSGKNG